MTEAIRGLQSPSLTATAGAVLLLCAVHLVTPELRMLRGTPRSVWLSVAGGVSVAYVFVHLLPELAEGQRHIDGMFSAGSDAGLWHRVLERLVFLSALSGLALFFGLDKLVRSPGRMSSRGVFSLHMASFAMYNLLVGYLIARGERRTADQLLWFTVAMALHFLVTGFGLAEDHARPYRLVGRWLLAASVACGALLGLQVEVPQWAVATLVAFLAGGVILNAMKEEMPQERQSRFWAFALGAGGYAGLLLSL